MANSVLLLWTPCGRFSGWLSPKSHENKNVANIIEVEHETILMVYPTDN